MIVRAFDLRGEPAAALDPTTRRIRLPNGTQVVVTDTVGFIRDLPKELLGAFEATLEEAAAAEWVIKVRRVLMEISLDVINGNGQTTLC